MSVCGPVGAAGGASNGDGDDSDGDASVMAALAKSLAEGGDGDDAAKKKRKKSKRKSKSKWASQTDKLDLAVRARERQKIPRETFHRPLNQSEIVGRNRWTNQKSSLQALHALFFHRMIQCYPLEAS